MAVCLFQPSKLETSFLVETDYFLPSGNFEGITTEPVDPVMVDRHPALFLVVQDVAERISILDETDGKAFAGKIGYENGLDGHSSQHTGAISLLDPGPEFRDCSLIVINRDV